MSRVRSQLDNLLDQPHPSRDDRGAHRAPVAQREAHVDTVQRKLDAAWGGPAANPAPRYQSQADKPRGDTADLARIRDSLDRLAGRLGSMGVAESRQRPQPYREPEPRQRPAAPREPLPPHPPARAAESEQFAAIGRQMRDELHALRNQIADAFEALEHKRDSNGADEPMRDELHRLVDMVSRLDQQSRQAPDHLEDVSIELRNLHGLLQDMAGRDTSGIDGLTRSIETSYAELAGRMEEMIASLMNELPRSREDSELRGELSMLGENVAVIRDAIDRLPGRLSTGVIEEGLDKLAGSIEALSDSEERSLSRHFGEIDARLDEITRALVAVSAGPGDGDAYDRIEARIATLAKTVEQMAEDWQESTALPSAGIESFAGEVKAALANIDGRLSELGQASAPPAGGFDEIAARIATLSDKLDNMQGFGAVAASMSGDDELVTRLDAIAARLEELDRPNAGSGEQDGAALAAIERQLAEMVARFDLLADTGSRDNGGDNDEIVGMLQALAARIDALADARPPQLPEADQIAALEKQLGGIVSQLDTISTSGFYLAPISERLDSIEQQVAHSRDIAIDVASQAAERAVGMASGGSAIDPDLVESLRHELHDLNSNSRDIGARNVAAFETVHEALSVIVDRLGDIETRLHGETRQGARAHQAGAAHLVEDDYASHDGSGDPYHDRPVDRSSRAGHDDDEVAFREEAAEPLAQLDEAPALDARDAVAESGEDETGEVEDVPLEPGSGGPDFAALVRQAAAKRKNPAETASPHAAADLITAARRAAKAAAREASGAERAERKEAEGEPARPSRQPGLLKKLLARPARLVLFAAAIAAIAVFAVPFANRMISGTPEMAATPSSEQERPSQDAGNADPAALQGTAAGNQAGNAVPVGAGSPDTGEDVSPGIRTAAGSDTGPSVQSETGDAPVRTAGGELSVTPVPAEMAEAAMVIPAPPVEVGNVALRQAAENGDGAALFEIARRYTDGDPVERDLAKAAEWYELSARSGFAPAQYRLGNFFEKGHGVVSDVDKAVLWYQRAAEQGNALAMHNLAVLYTSGLIGGSPDMEGAVEWFSQAAELGVKDSQVNLGILYTRGMGVNEDLVEAYKWFAVAARAGDADAASKRDMLANAMRPDQLEKARGEATLWTPASIDASANTVVVKPEWNAVDSRSAASAPASTAPASTASAAAGAAPASSTRQMVERAQTLLSALGFDAGPSDGVMGQKTRDAVRAFQRSAGMKVDGEVSDELIEALEKGAA